MAAAGCFGSESQREEAETYEKNVQFDFPKGCLSKFKSVDSEEKPDIIIKKINILWIVSDFLLIEASIPRGEKQGQ